MIQIILFADNENATSALKARNSYLSFDNVFFKINHHEENVRLMRIEIIQLYLLKLKHFMTY